MRQTSQSVLWVAEGGVTRAERKASETAAAEEALMGEVMEPGMDPVPYRSRPHLV